MATVGGYQPKERAGHCAITVDDCLYMWGGDQADLSLIEIYHLLTGKWEQKTTTGNPPLGAIGYCAAAIGKEIYYFGGCQDGNYYNSIHCLNVDTLHWREYSPNTVNRGRPLKKAYCGMIPVQFDGQYYLAVFGGRGPSTNNAPYQTGAQYDKDKNYTPTMNHTNEVHYYHIATDQWITPVVRGRRAPPCSSFTLTSITNDSAILFGGATSKGDSNQLFAVYFTKSSVSFQEIPKGAFTVDWPKARSSHSTVLISSTVAPYLLVVGGNTNDNWLFDINKRQWKMITVLPDSFSDRTGHSLSVWNLTPSTIWTIVFGGRRKQGSMFKGIIVVELTYNDDKWSIGTVPLEQYTETMKERKRKWEEFDSSSEETRRLAQIHQLTRQVQEMEAKIQSLQLEISQKEQQRQQQLQEKDQELEKAAQEIQAKNEQIQAFQYSIGLLQETQQTKPIPETQIQQQESYWVVNKEEITVTEEVVDKGEWGEIKVAEFRGLRVAAKSLPKPIISQDNMDAFAHEMEIASQVRHPNLLQFIGATHEDNPIILTELMPTSLRKELENGSPLPHHIVLSISLDVAYALNYLHLFRPHPIIHRGVSSAKVLLSPTNEGWRAKVSDYESGNLQNLISHTSNPGNLLYSSPESFNPRLLSPAMDVYSYGVLLLEMIICHAPKPTERLILVNAIAEPTLKALVQHCLIDDKTLRPSMSDIITALQITSTNNIH